MLIIQLLIHGPVLLFIFAGECTDDAANLIVLREACLPVLILSCSLINL